MFLKAFVPKSAFEKSGRVQSLSIGVNGAVEHQADHGQGDHRFGDLWQLFVILGEAPPSSEPAKCSFDHPPARQGNKAGGPCDRSHNDQGQAEQETGQEDSGAVVDTVSEHHLEPAVEWLDFAQKIPALSASWMFAGWTTRPSSKPEVSTAMWRL